jgi:hypothetical protein
MSHLAIDLIENGSYQKAAELMLGDIYREHRTEQQIDYWTSEIKRKHEHAKKKGFITKEISERIYFVIRERMTPQTGKYRSL